MVAAFKSEWVAAFKSEYPAGFIGIRNVDAVPVPHGRLNIESDELVMA